MFGSIFCLKSIYESYLALILFKRLFRPLTLHPVVIDNRVHVLILSSTWLGPLPVFLPSSRRSLQFEQVTLDHSDIVFNLWDMIDQKGLRTVTSNVVDLLLDFIDPFSERGLFVLWGKIGEFGIGFWDWESVFKIVFHHWRGFASALDVVNVLANEVFGHCGRFYSKLFLFRFYDCRSDWLFGNLLESWESTL